MGRPAPPFLPFLSMKLLDRVRRTIRHRNLAEPGVRVVAAVSGGSDSVALAHLLRALADAGDLTFTGVAHFNHQLRPAADEDQEFCARLAASLAVPFVSDRGDVAALAKADRRSLEDAGRALRHAFLDRARLHFDADVVATGHTRDDQAETFLLRLLRGAGARGLSAMHPRHGTIVRPLLDCRRAELRAHLEAGGLRWQHDETNDDVQIPRNRVRAELLPLLEERFNPEVVDVLANAADVAREEWQWLATSADILSSGLRRLADDGWHLDVAALRAAPVALARMVVWQTVTDVAGGRPVGFAHVDEVLGLLRAPEGAQLDLPGQQAQRLGQAIVLKGKPLPERTSPARGYWYPLPVPGATPVREAGVVVTAEVGTDWDAGYHGARAPAGPERAVVQGVGAGQLAVRSWRAGDRFRPLGLSGRKKLQDLFVDRKVPRADRPMVPLVVDEFDRIIWVAGLGIAEEFRVTEPAQPVLVLRLKPLGGPT